MNVRYEFARCTRCKAQLEPAPFGTPDNDDDWGHPTADGAQCWPESESRPYDSTAPPLFEVERVTLEYDGHTYKEV